MANVFLPQTIDASFAHKNYSEQVPGIKFDSALEAGSSVLWNNNGHNSRLINVGSKELTLFARLYDSEGTPAWQARLPALHAKQLVAVLEKFANQPKRLGDLQGQYFSTVMFDETYAQRDGTILRGRLNSLKIHHNGFYLARTSLLGHRSTRLHAKTVH